jgi:hypothetical protein
MSKILITGDSFACGEWSGHKGKNSPNVATSILDKLFENDGHEVIVDCTPGGSDYNSLNSIEKHKDKVDTIIYYKTCPSRMLEDHEHAKNLLKDNENDLYKTLQQLNDEVYYKLENTSHRVFLIGGLNKITKDVNVEYILPSILEHLTDKTFPEYEFGVDFIESYKKCADDGCVNLNDLNSILDLSKKFISTIMDTGNTLLKPDGAHPNREGITILYNLIRDKI